MLVIEFMKRYSDLMRARVAGEFGAEVAARLTEVYGEEQGKGTLDLDLKHEDTHYGITLTMQHPLAAQTKHEYFPEVTDAEWGVFMGRSE